MSLVKDLKAFLTMFRFYISNVPHLSFCYCVLVLLSVLAPGYAGSKLIADKADQLSNDLRAIRFGIQSKSMIIHDLLDKYFRGKRDERTDEACKEVINAAETDDHSRLVLQNILSFDKPWREIQPQKEGKRLIEALQSSFYPKQTCLDVYRYVACWLTARKYGIASRLKVPYLHGPSGSGKTHLARLIAESLSIPFCPTSASNGFHSMFETRSLFMTFLRKAESYPILVFFDELDKYSTYENDTLLAWFNGEIVQSPSLYGAPIPTDMLLTFAAGNQPLRLQKNSQVDEHCTALADRFTQIKMSCYGPKLLRRIVDQHVEDLRKKTQFYEPFDLEHDLNHPFEQDSGSIRYVLDAVQTSFLRAVSIRDGWASDETFHDSEYESEVK